MKYKKIIFTIILLIFTIPDFICSDDEVRPFTTNLEVAKLMQIDKLWVYPYYLSGANVNLAVFDWGQIRATHQEFQKNGSSKIVVMGDNNTPDFHSTAMGGIIAAEGVEADAKGIAGSVTLYSYLISENSYGRAIAKAYDDGITFSNHSYLYGSATALGEYDVEAYLIDQIVYDNPYLNAFFPSGNNRGSEGYTEYGITKGPSNSKNILTIGSTMDNGDTISDYSNTGPVDDGRIKPDLTAPSPGNGRSYTPDSSEDNAYLYMGGTSAATARVSAASVLLFEQYKRETGEQRMRHDVLKSILINTATDKGRAGPDYEFGFGIINPKKAVDTIKTINTNMPLIQTSSISQNEIRTYSFSLSRQENIKITLNWVDPSGDFNNQNRTLVNDIDMWVAQGTKTYYPYYLNKDNPTQLAKADQFNTVDNCEQIEIKNAQAGTYTLYVKGKMITTGNQNYAITSSCAFAYSNDNSNYYLKKPTNLGVSEITENSVALGWSDNAQNENAYLVYRDNKLIKTLPGNSISYVDTTIVPNSTYRYSIKASSEFGNSAVVDIIVSTTSSIPSAPINLRARALSSTSVELIWSDISANETGFKIIRDQELIATIQNNVTSFIDPGLNSEKAYTYLIKSTNSAGDSSGISIVITTKDGKYELVENFYTKLLEREFDIEGVEFWVDKLNNGSAATELAKFFLHSDEFISMNVSNQDYIERLYKTFFNRDADNEGLAYWIDQLEDKGKSRDLIMYEFIFSNEFNLFCKDRNVTNYFTGDQLEAFIERMYVLVLKRDSDPAGMEYWVNNLTTKTKSGTDIVKDFFYSQEFLNQNLNNREFVQVSYRSILGREAEGSGFDFWLSKLDNGEISRDDLLNEFLNSNEFAALTQKYQIDVK